jgi:DNA ligase (NAD+)
VGEVTARNLAQHYGSMEALMAADVESLTAVPDVGLVVAGHVHAFFREPHNVEIISALREAGVEWQAPQVETGSRPLEGQTWVLTGTLAMPRAQARQLLEMLGARITGSVSQRTSVVLAGEAAGSKLDKAARLGIQVMDEQAFLELLKENGLSAD